MKKGGEEMVRQFAAVSIGRWNHSLDMIKSSEEPLSSLGGREATRNHSLTQELQGTAGVVKNGEVKVLTVYLGGFAVS